MCPGQVTRQACERQIGASGVGEANAFAEFLKGQSTLTNRIAQHQDAALTVGIGREDRRSLGLRILVHERHRTATAAAHVGVPVVATALV